VQTEKKTEILLGVATLANLCVVGWYFLIKPAPACTVPERTGETGMLQEMKEELFFRGLRDENRQGPLHAVAASSPRFVMRFSFRNCDLCIKSAFDELHRMEKDFGSENIFLAGTFLSSREFEIFEQSEKPFGFTCHNVPEALFGLHAERDADQPFFFVLFPDGEIRHVFFPMKEDVERTRKYLPMVQERYFVRKPQ